MDRKKVITSTSDNSMDKRNLIWNIYISTFL